jgi:hypothetical protein
MNVFFHGDFLNKNLEPLFSKKKKKKNSYIGVHK